MMGGALLVSGRRGVGAPGPWPDRGRRLRAESGRFRLGR